MFTEFANALVAALSWPYVLYVIGGAALGLVVGIIPGLGGSIAIALLIPITVGWDPIPSFLLMAAILSATSFGGAITAILINTPGTAVSVATLFDGYPMNRNGRGAEAIGVAGMAGLIGSLIGTALLLSLLPASRQMILAFSYPEILVITLVGIAMIGAVSEGGVVRATIAGCVGVLLAMVGRSPVTAERRFDGGLPLLEDGIHLLTIIIAAFALPEAVRLLRQELGGGREASERAQRSVRVGTERRTYTEIGRGLRSTVRHPRLLAQGSFIGTLIGIVPAVGGTVAGLVSYTSAKQTVRDPEQFGKGDPRGLLAVETATNSKDLGGVLPTVMFGLPGTPAYAVMLAAFLMHGVTPGSSMLTDRVDITMIIIAGLVIGSFINLAIGVTTAPVLIRLANLPAVYLCPIICVVGVLGAYAIRVRALDALIVVIAAIACYVLRHYQYSLVALIIAMSLTRSVELAYEQTLLTHGIGSLFQRPLTIAMFAVALAVLVLPVIALRRSRALQAQGVGAKAKTSDQVSGGELALMAGLTGVFAWVLVMATQLSRPASQRFPIAVCTIALCLLGARFVAVGIAWWRLRRGADQEQEEPAEMPTPDHVTRRTDPVPTSSGTVATTARTERVADDDVSDAAAPRLPLGAGSRTLTPLLLGWMTLCGVLMYFFGYRVSVPAFLVVFLAWLRVPPLKLVVVAATTSAALYAIFSVGLGLR